MVAICYALEFELATSLNLNWSIAESNDLDRTH